MNTEPLTVKLNTGVEVLAKLHHSGSSVPCAVTYANRTQAERKLLELGSGWCIHRPGRPFYIAKELIEKGIMKTESWTIRVSETLPHNGKRGWFGIGRFYNGIAESWRCYCRPGFHWLMPKNEAEADQKMMRYVERETAVREARILAELDRIPFDETQP